MAYIILIIYIYMCVKSKQFWSVTDPNLSQSPDQVTVSKEKGVGSIPCVQGMGQPLVASSCNLLWLIMVINNQHGNLLSDNLVCYSFDICILITMVYNSELETESLHTAHQSDLAPKNMVISSSLRWGYSEWPSIRWPRGASKKWPVNTPSEKSPGCVCLG